jgi:hypothetical protein
MCVTQHLAFRQSGRTQPTTVALWVVRSLAIGSEHTVIRCRLDFLTNRQLRKLRTLAELRLAAVSSLQHCAITLVGGPRHHPVLRCNSWNPLLATLLTCTGVELQMAS